MLLRDCPAAALPASQALRITQPASQALSITHYSGSKEGRASQQLALSWAFIGTRTGKELNDVASSPGSSKSGRISVITLN